MDDRQSERRRDYSRDPLPYKEGHPNHLPELGWDDYKRKRVAVANRSWLASSAFLLVLFGGGMVWQHGLDSIVLWIALIFWALFTFALFLETRPQELPPTSAEYISATVWLWIRRLVASLGALLFLTLFFVLVRSWRSGGPGPETGSIALVLDVILLLGIGIFILWFGWVGRTDPLGLPEADLETHRRRQRRFGWKW